MLALNLLVSEASHELLVLLAPPPEYWDCRYYLAMSSCAAVFSLRPFLTGTGDRLRQGILKYFAVHSCLTPVGALDPLSVLESKWSYPSFLTQYLLP